MKSSNGLTNIKELLEIIKHKMDGMGMSLTTQSATVRRIKEQQSVINEKLDTQEKKLDALWDQTVKLTEDTNDIQDSLDSHSTALKTISANTEHTNENIRKLNKRTKTLEDKAGIVSPPELTIP